MLRPSRSLAALVPLLLAGLGGCTSCLVRTAPGKVAMGVARLTIRHAGAVVSLADADTRCGFSSDVVKRGIVVQGQPGQQGAVVLEARECKLEFPTETVVGTDCEGVDTLVQGTVTVSGTKRVRGTITGSAEKPVIPDGADAVTFDLTADFSGLTVKKSASAAFLTTDSGRLHFVLEPRVALSKSLGVCAVPTLDVSLSDVAWRDGLVTVHDGSRVFAVDVAQSKYVAQVGKWLEHENDFSGSISVFGGEVALPVAGEPTAVDDEYTPEAYFKSIACKPDLATPVSYACPSMKEQIVHGAMRLGISQLGAVTSLVDADARCGFSTPAVLAAAQLSGTTGGLGSARLTLPAPCTLSFATPAVIGTGCTGVTQTAEGSVTVTGTKTLSGVLSGDVSTPVVPNGRDPAALALTLSFSNFKLTDSASTARFMKVVRGTLSATVVPRVAIDSRSGICSVSTSAVEFRDVTWSDALVEVTSDGLTFQAPLSQAVLQAQSGTKGDRTNYLAGTAISDGIPVTIPPPGAAPVLDPAYDAAAFEATYACKPGYLKAPDEEACLVDRALALNVARLLLLTAGTTASQLQGDTSCGFSAFSVKTNPTRVTGDDGQMGELQWDIQNCRVGQAGTAAVSTDCTGVVTYVQGTANATAQRIVKGERDTELVLFDSIIPRSRDALSISLSNTALTGYSVFKVLPGEATPFAKLVLHSGTLSGKVTPGLGERTSKPGVFDVGTPVATFTDVQLMNATATLSVAGKQFTLQIPNAQISGQNGAFRGVVNTVFGTLAVSNGGVVTLPQGTVLDPTFTQASFDESYSCTADLKGLIPPN